MNSKRGDRIEASIGRVNKTTTGMYADFRRAFEFLFAQLFLWNGVDRLARRHRPGVCVVIENSDGRIQLMKRVDPLAAGMKLHVTRSSSRQQLTKAMLFNARFRGVQFVNQDTHQQRRKLLPKGRGKPSARETLACRQDC